MADIGGVDLVFGFPDVGGGPRKRQKRGREEHVDKIAEPRILEGGASSATGVADALSSTRRIVRAPHKAEGVAQAAIGIIAPIAAGDVGSAQLVGILRERFGLPVVAVTLEKDGYKIFYSPTPDFRTLNLDQYHIYRHQKDRACSFIKMSDAATFYGIQIQEAAMPVSASAGVAPRAAGHAGALQLAAQLKELGLPISAVIHDHDKGGYRIIYATKLDFSLVGARLQARKIFQHRQFPDCSFINDSDAQSIFGVEIQGPVIEAAAPVRAAVAEKKRKRASPEPAVFVATAPLAEIGSGEDIDNERIISRLGEMGIGDVSVKASDGGWTLQFADKAAFSTLGASKITPSPISEKEGLLKRADLEEFLMVGPDLPVSIRERETVLQGQLKGFFDEIKLPTEKIALERDGYKISFRGDVEGNAKLNELIEKGVIRKEEDQKSFFVPFGGVVLLYLGTPSVQGFVLSTMQTYGISALDGIEMNPDDAYYRLKNCSGEIPSSLKDVVHVDPINHKDYRILMDRLGRLYNIHFFPLLRQYTNSGMIFMKTLDGISQTVVSLKIAIKEVEEKLMHTKGTKRQKIS